MAKRGKYKGEQPRTVEAAGGAGERFFSFELIIMGFVAFSTGGVGGTRREQAFMGVDGARRRKISKKI